MTTLAQWSSSNTHVALVGPGGVVLALAAGESDISAVYQGQSAIYHAVVIADHISITGSTPAQGTVVMAGQPAMFSMNVYYVMDSKPLGYVTIIIQDQDGRPLQTTQPQIRVSQGDASLTIADAITVPPGTSRVDVFAALFAIGYQHATWATHVSYPVQ